MFAFPQQDNRKFYGSKIDTSGYAHLKAFINFAQCSAEDIIHTFVVLSAGHRSDYFRKGKSGQQRATHRLSAGFIAQAVKEKVPQKITALVFYRGKGENVR